MKIAMIAPFIYPIPPKLYGGSESVVHYLTEGLVKKGHEVTLFCQKGSRTSAKQDSTWGKYQDGGALDIKNIFYSLQRMNYYIEESRRFNVIHNHSGYLFLSFSRYFKTPVINTLHSRYDTKMISQEVAKSLFHDSLFVSISKSQQKQELFKLMKFIGNVYNGTVDFDRYKLGKGGDYLVWIGRFCQEKGAKEAIEIAKKSKQKLIMAAKADDNEYYRKYIKPEVNGKNIVFIGEVGLEEKNKLLGEAKAFLMPINWQEPFGLVMIESMACGTPVIAYNQGSVPEIIQDGETGFIIKHGDINGMVEAVKKIDQIDRRVCREHVAENFSIEKMVDSYEALYKKIINK